MPDYGSTPKIREVEFGEYGPIPRVKRVKKLPLQLGREYRMMFQAGSAASRVAGAQIARLATEWGLKGKRVHELRWFAEEQALKDTMKLLKEIWENSKIKMAPITEEEFPRWYQLYKETYNLPPEEKI